jgi:putative membrane protein
MEQFWLNVLSSFVFGILGIAMAVGGFKLFDLVTPHIKVEQELAEKQNLAVAVVCAALILGISYIVARVVGGPSGT